MYTPDYLNRVAGQSQGNIVVISTARAKPSPNAVWEPSDKKVNGCEHYAVLPPPHPLIANNLYGLYITHRRPYFTYHSPSQFTAEICKFRNNRKVTWLFSIQCEFPLPCTTSIVVDERLF